MSNDRGGIFSESRGQVEDGFANATGVEHATGDLKEGMKEATTTNGITMMSDCAYCGLQWRGVIRWNEIYDFFLGKPVAGTKATRPGIVSAFHCRSCRNITKFVIPWEDIERYVARGVGFGVLPKDIYAAREEIMRRRAAAAGQTRR